jgi:plastocyanin
VRTMRVTLFLVVPLLLAAGCGGAKTGEAALELSDFAFKPLEIGGDPGQKMRLHLKNEGTVEHNLTVEGQGIDRDLEPGQSTTVVVTIPPSDRVVYFFCKYHKSQGMTGLLGEGGYFPGG